MTNSNLKKQQGVVLAVCLILLLLLTMIGITGMQSTSLEEKMAGNTHNLNRSFDAAESALRIGEQFIDGLVVEVTGANCVAACGNHIYTLGHYDPSNINDWVSTQMTQLQAPGPTITGVNPQPMYYLEYEDALPGRLNIGGGGITVRRVSYRVSAHGVGGNTLARTTLQTQFVREFF